MKRCLQNLKLKIGILGGGQLGWMLILEGRKFPFQFYVLESDPSYPACKIADRYYNPEQYKNFVEDCDIITYEFEHVYDKALEYAYEKGKLIPSLGVVELKRERHKEKLFYRDNGFPTPKFFMAENGEEALEIAKKEFYGVAVVKQSKGGYDGKNQYFLRNDFEKYEFIKNINEKFVVEEFVEFDYETSVIVVRDGRKTAAYPPTFNLNKSGILIYNYGPFGVQRIQDIAISLAERLNYIGTMGVEFMVKDGKVYINEFAPRVHNTGHYTLDSAFVSQFENHIRAIAQIELGSTDLISFGGMLNILGRSDVDLSILNYGKLYWYGKKDARKRRKMGHINVIGKSLDEVKEKINELIKIVYPEGVEEYI